MEKRLVFMQVTPVFPTFVKKWCLEELYDLGYETVVADFSPVVNRETDSYLTQARMKDIPELNIRYKRFFSWNQIEEFFGKNKEKSFFFTMFYNYYQVKNIFFLLKKYEIRHACLSGISSEFGVGDAECEVIPLADRLKYKHIKEAIYNRLLTKIIPRKKPDFIAIGSRKNEEYHCRMNQCKKGVKRIYAYSYDYENYLRASAYNNDNRAYCVFMDLYIPYHPDFVIEGSIKVNPKSYYRELNLIFDAIRKEYNLDVIIAAHPRADYLDKKECYPGCKIFYGESASLVKGAKLVLAQFSNSISYAVMGNKPVIIINNKSISRIRWFDEKCKKYAEVLKLKIVSSPEDIRGDLYEYNQDVYQKFMKERVTYNIQKSPCLWKIITDNICL